jgi:hypothetical protein
MLVTNLAIVLELRASRRLENGVYHLSTISTAAQTKKRGYYDGPLCP